MLLPVASRWRYDSDPVFTNGSVKGGTLFKHKRFGSLRIVYAGVMAVSIFMAKDQNSLSGHNPLTMSKTHRFNNFSSPRSVDATY